MLNLFIILIHFLNLEAASYGGFFTLKQQYLIDKDVEESATVGRFKFYEDTKFSNSFSTKLEGRVEFLTTPLIFQENEINLDREKTFDLYWGETYFRYKVSSVIFQLGFQEIVWGEAFGFNSADFINPKNFNYTLLTESDDARRPLPLAQVRFIGDSTTLQMIYGAKPSFHKTYPNGLIFKDIFTQNELKVKSDEIDWFDKHEGGGKVSSTISGVDLSVYGYSYLDRNPYYELIGFDSNYLELAERHSRINSYGLSVSTTLKDFVVRGDYIQHYGKKINYFDSLSLKEYSTAENAITLSFDTPTYSGFSFFVVWSLSQLGNEYLENSFRKKNQNVISLKTTKEFNSEAKLHITFFSELIEKSNGLQIEADASMNSQLDISLGTEIYFGDKNGAAARFKKFNNVFIKFKNFFNF